MGVLSKGLTQVLTSVDALIGIGFALLQWLLVSKVKVSSTHHSSTVEDEYKRSVVGDSDMENGVHALEVTIECAEIQNAIPVGGTSFLFTVYRYLTIFMGVFGAIIFLFLGSVKGFITKREPWTYNTGNLCKPALANAVLLGAFTSVLSGFLGMKNATYANARTTLESRKGIGKAFVIAFGFGAMMVFFFLQMASWCCTSLSILVGTYTEDTS